MLKCCCAGITLSIINWYFSWNQSSHCNYKDITAGSAVICTIPLETLRYCHCSIWSHAFWTVRHHFWTNWQLVRSEMSDVQIRLCVRKPCEEILSRRGCLFLFGLRAPLPITLFKSKKIFRNVSYYYNTNHLRQVSNINTLTCCDCFYHMCPVILYWSLNVLVLM